MFKSVVSVALQWTEGKRTVYQDLNLSPVYIGVVIFRFSASTCFKYVWFYLFIYFFICCSNMFSDIGKIRINIFCIVVKIRILKDSSLRFHPNLLTIKDHYLEKGYFRMLLYTEIIHLHSQLFQRLFTFQMFSLWLQDPRTFTHPKRPFAQSVQHNMVLVEPSENNGLTDLPL